MALVGYALLTNCGDGSIPAFVLREVVVMALGLVVICGVWAPYYVTLGAGAHVRCSNNVAFGRPMDPGDAVGLAAGAL